MDYEVNRLAKMGYSCTIAPFDISSLVQVKDRTVHVDLGNDILVGEIYPTNGARYCFSTRKDCSSLLHDDHRYRPIILVARRYYVYTSSNMSPSSTVDAVYGRFLRIHPYREKTPVATSRTNENQ